MLQHTLVGICAGIGMSVVGIAAASAGPVDLFEDGHFHLQATVSDGGSPIDSVTETGLDPSTVLGGRRDTTLTNGGTHSLATAQLNTTGGDDAVVAQTETGAAIRLHLDYGLGGDLNADLNRFSAISMFFDELPLFAAFEAQLTSGSGSGTVMVDPVALAAQIGTAPGEVRFGFSAPGFSEVNFSDVDAMRFTVTTDFDDRFTLARINTIPLPPALWPGVSTMAALLLAHHWPLAARRRRG